MKRFRSSVYSGREELLLVRTLTFLSLNLSHAQEDVYNTEGKGKTKKTKNHNRSLKRLLISCRICSTLSLRSVINTV